MFHYSSNYYLLLNNTRSNKVDDLRVSLFIKLLFLDNSSAFRFLIIYQALWPNGSDNRLLTHETFKMLVQNQ